MKVPELVGGNIRWLREGAGLTQAELAQAMQALGFRQWVRQTVAETEAGRREATIAEVVALAAYFEMPLHALLVAPGGMIPTREVEVGGREVDVFDWRSLVAQAGRRQDELPNPLTRKAIDVFTSGLERPWAQAWRKKKGHPAEAFDQSWQKLTSERRPYPGPTFLYEGAGELTQSYIIGPWGQAVSFTLHSGEPYVARNDEEAERLLQLVEVRTDLRRITRQEAYRLRQRKGK